MDKPVTTKDIETVLNAINEASSDTQKQFDLIRDHMATKEDLEGVRKEIKTSEQKVMDHVDRSMGGLEGGLNVKQRKVDEKVDLVVDVLENHELATDEELQQIRDVQVFPAAPTVS